MVYFQWCGCPTNKYYVFYCIVWWHFQPMCTNITYIYALILSKSPVIQNVCFLMRFPSYLCALILLSLAFGCINILFSCFYIAFFVIVVHFLCNLVIFFISLIFSWPCCIAARIFFCLLITFSHISVGLLP